MRNVNVVLAVSLLLGGAALADTSQLTDPGGRRFLEKAAAGGMAEVKLGRLAEQRGQSPAVKAFGRKMVDDHSKVNREIKILATQKGVNLPTSVDPEDQRTYDRLSELSGDQFDRAYMDAMIKDHDTDISEFKKQAEQGHDADIKAFASKTLPTLEQHDEAARAAMSKIGASPVRTPMKDEAAPRNEIPPTP